MKMSFYIKEVTPYLSRQHAGWPLKWRLRMGTRGSRQMESLSACARSNKLLISFPKKQRDDLNLERKAPAGRFLFAWWSWSCMSFISTFIAFGGGGGVKSRIWQEWSSDHLNYSSPSMCGCPQKTMVSWDKRQQEKQPGKVLRTVQSILKAREAW